MVFDSTLLIIFAVESTVFVSIKLIFATQCKEKKLCALGSAVGSLFLGTGIYYLGLSNTLDF